MSRNARRELSNGRDVLFVAHLAFQNLADLGAVVLLLRRSMELVLGSVLVGLDRQPTSDDVLGEGADALKQARFWTSRLGSDVERVCQVVRTAPGPAVASSDERAALSDALAAAGRIARAVERFHESRKPPRTRRRLYIVGLGVVVVAGLIFAIIHLRSRPEGLMGVYYADAHFQRPVLRRVDAQLDFDWGHDAPDPKLPVDRFSVEWTGTLLVPEDAEYVIYLASDDGSRLAIDGHVVIDHWGEHSSDEFKQESLTLKQGSVSIRLQYFESSSRAVVRLHWSSKRILRGPITAKYLRP